MSFGQTDRTCAVWLAGKYMGTFTFDRDVADVFSKWMASGSVVMNSRRDDIDLEKMMPFAMAEGMARRSPVDLRGSVELRQHWWAGGPPADLALIIAKGLKLIGDAATDDGPVVQQTLFDRETK